MVSDSKEDNACPLARGGGQVVRVPEPTPIYRITHVDNLGLCLRRGSLHAPEHTPDDGLVYRTIHDVDIQQKRRITHIPCGPGGAIHDYVPFYFGPRSPMLYRLHKGWVGGYTEGQEPIIYLVSTAQAVQASGAEFVFSDGHGLVAFTEWYHDLNDLDRVDWKMVYDDYWVDDPDADMDRKRRKQAEFLVHRFCDWALIQEIAVLNDSMKSKVEGVLGSFPPEQRRPVCVRPDWYY